VREDSSAALAQCVIDTNRDFSCDVPMLLLLHHHHLASELGSELGSEPGGELGSVLAFGYLRARARIAKYTGVPAAVYSARGMPVSARRAKLHNRLRRLHALR
jgi:hypothetical protein